MRVTAILLVGVLLGCSADRAANHAADHAAVHTADCKSSFMAAVAAGQINSVNGLAIAPGYSAYFNTAWHNDKAGLMQSICNGGVWSAPKRLFETELYQDYQPTLSRDGLRLYFTSTRPLEGGAPVRQNLWMSRYDGGWGEPEPLPTLESDHWDGHAIELSPGTLLFASGRGGDTHMVDLYQAKKAGDGFEITPVDILNSTHSDNDMAFDYDTGLLVFSRYDPAREDIDLFAALQRAGGWTTPVALDELKSSAWEMSPAFTPDGETLLYKQGDRPFKIVDKTVIMDFINGLTP